MGTQDQDQQAWGEDAPQQDQQDQQYSQQDQQFDQQQPEDG